MNMVSEISIPLMPVETPEFAADPDPFLKAARAQHPWLARFSQGYFVHGYNAVTKLLSDDERLIPGFGPIVDFYNLRGTMWGRFMDELVMSRSGAEHARLRSAMAGAFTPRRAKQERETMQQVITTLLDEWAPKGEFDFAVFASYFPITVMCGVLGISAEPIPRMRGALETQLMPLTYDPAVKDQFMAGWDVVWEFVDTTIKDREASGEFEEGALLDSLIASKNAGQIDETELRFALLASIEAGYDTSKNQLGVMMKLLMENPEMYERCADDLDFCRKVVEESLRHSGIVTSFRIVAEDFTFDDFQFRKGEHIALAEPLANRDPSVFPDPEKFDPDRENAGRHISFGRGAHICLGQFMARSQLQEGIHLIAQRLKNPRLNGKIEYRPFLGAWGLRSLPIAFDAA